MWFSATYQEWSDLVKTCLPVLLNQWHKGGTHNQRSMSPMSYTPVLWASGDNINRKGRDQDASIMGRG